MVKRQQRPVMSTFDGGKLGVFGKVEGRRERERERHSRERIVYNSRLGSVYDQNKARFDHVLHCSRHH